MKKYASLMIAVLGLLSLWGCSSGAAVTWETVTDSAEAAHSEPARFTMVLPTPGDGVWLDELSEGPLRICSGAHWMLAVEALEASSLDELLLELTGKTQDQLTIITSHDQGFPRYDLTWACGGEDGLELRRCAILDDGQHYYVATAFLNSDSPEALHRIVEACFSDILLVPTSGTLI